MIYSVFKVRSVKITELIHMKVRCTIGTVAGTLIHKNNVNIKHFPMQLIQSIFMNILILRYFTYGLHLIVRDADYIHITTHNLMYYRVTLGEVFTTSLLRSLKGKERGKNSKSIVGVW